MPTPPTTPPTTPAAPDTPPPPVTPATLTPALPGATGKGQRGFIAPDGTRIVVQLDRHDTAAEGALEHVGIGVTVWEVDATGARTGTALARWPITIPVGVVQSGQRTLADIQAQAQADAVTRLLGVKSVRAQLAALDLADPPAPAVPATTPPLPPPPAP